MSFWSGIVEAVTMILQAFIAMGICCVLIGLSLVPILLGIKLIGLILGEATA